MHLTCNCICSKEYLYRRLWFSSFYISRIIDKVQKYTKSRNTKKIGKKREKLNVIEMPIYIDSSHPITKCKMCLDLNVRVEFLYFLLNSRLNSFPVCYLIVTHMNFHAEILISSNDDNTSNRCTFKLKQFVLHCGNFYSIREMQPNAIGSAKIQTIRECLVIHNMIVIIAHTRNLKRECIVMNRDSLT